MCAPSLVAVGEPHVFRSDLYLSRDDRESLNERSEHKFLAVSAEKEKKQKRLEVNTMYGYI